MKGLFSKLAIVAAVAVLFSACGDDKKAEEAAPQAVEEQATTQAPADQNTEAAAPEANAEANTEAPADQNADEAAQAGTEEGEQAPKTEEAK